MLAFLALFALLLGGVHAHATSIISPMISPMVTPMSQAGTATAQAGMDHAACHAAEAAATDTADGDSRQGCCPDGCSGLCAPVAAIPPMTAEEQFTAILMPHARMASSGMPLAAPEGPERPPRPEA